MCVVAVRFERAKRRLNRTMEKIDHAKEQLKVYMPSLFSRD
jgi:hypothetical protein